MARRPRDDGSRRCLDPQDRSRARDRLSEAGGALRVGLGGGTRRFHPRDQVLGTSGSLPRRPHRPRDSPGAPIRRRHSRRLARRRLEPGADRQRSVPVRGSRTEPPLGVSGGLELSCRAGWATGSGPSHRGRRRRAHHQARRAHLGRAGFRRHSAGPRGVRTPRPGPGRAQLSVDVHLRDRLQQPPPAVRPPRRAPAGSRRRGPPGDRGGLPLRVRNAG